MATLASLADGALVKFGSIYGKPIIWRIAGQNHYASGQTSLVTDRIIKYMCVDGIEASNSDRNRSQYGNNRYIYSNMHKWLNSDATSWYSERHSADAPPSNANVWNNYNEYDAFPGFLNGFTAEEKDAICDTALTCEKSSTDGGGTDSFTAKVFLLSCTEVGLSGGQVCGTQFPMFNSDSARLAYGTAEAVANSEYKDSYISTTSPGWWWLRDAYASNSCDVRLVNTSGSLNNLGAYFGDCGARPALNLPSSISLSSSTDSDGCYTLVLVNTVTFNSNSGIFSSDSTTSKSVQTNLNGTVSLSTIVEFPTKSGYVFRGWSTSSTGSVVYTPYATPTITEDTTLYAVWQKAELYLVQEDSLVNVANAIRTKTSTTDKIALGAMATMIASIETGVDTSDATASSSDILSGKTAYINGLKVTGSITSKAAATYTPKTTNQTITAGQYLSGAQIVKGDSNLVAANIAFGKSIFGVSGSYTSDATATASDILSGKTAYIKGSKVTGTMESKSFPNGTVWTQSNITSGPFKSVYNAANGMWVAGGNDGLYYSTNGITWTASNLYKPVSSVYNANGMWVAGGNDGLYYSTDGKTWTASNISNTSSNIVYYANGIWVANASKLYYSTNGITWTASNLYKPVDSVYNANGIWVASTADYTGLYYSTDGKTWTASNKTSGLFKSIYNANGIWIAAATNSTGLYYSTDGKTWTASNKASGYYFYSVYYANGIWVAGGDQEGLNYSTDGKTWTQSNVTNSKTFYKNSVYNANGMWVAGGNDGLYYSTNGRTWTKSNISSSDLKPYYANGMWVAGGNDGLYYSIAWE